ncbi:hypothetical protein niasHT_006008 [Heterodera trifolii]|uniref:Uncharacterized protein n=1 Tax=Heterodera trifolii TaxID=157864 RepID=A0ABD2LWW7_9BILA
MNFLLFSFFLSVFSLFLAKHCLNAIPIGAGNQPNVRQSMVNDLLNANQAIDQLRSQLATASANDLNPKIKNGLNDDEEDERVNLIEDREFPPPDGFDLDQLSADDRGLLDSAIKLVKFLPRIAGKIGQLFSLHRQLGVQSCHFQIEQGTTKKVQFAGTIRKMQQQIENGQPLQPPLEAQQQGQQRSLLPSTADNEEHDDGHEDKNENDLMRDNAERFLFLLTAPLWQKLQNDR